MNTEYKGFIIFAANKEVHGPRFYVDSRGFNSNGYATMNNAKGAITKRLQAAEYRNQIAAEIEAHDAHALERMREVRKSGLAEFERCRRDEQDYLDSLTMVEENWLEQEAIIWWKEQYGIDFAPKTHVKQSRNKREGRYIGTFKGRHLRSVLPERSMRSLSLYSNGG